MPCEACAAGHLHAHVQSGVHCNCSNLFRLFAKLQRIAVQV